MVEVIETAVNFYSAIRASTSGLFHKFIVAIILLLIGFIVGKIFGRLVFKFLHSFEINNNFSKLSGTTLKLEEIAESFTTYFIYFITIVIVLQQMGLASTILHMIAGGIILLIILSTFLGIKDFIPNAIAGIVMQSNKQFRVGQIIKVKGMQGKIIKMTLLETKIETKKGDIIFIPNSVLNKTEVVYVRQKKGKRKNNISIKDKTRSE